MINKIHICGNYGSGKSSLAKNFSDYLDIPYHSLDDIKYRTKYYDLRPVDERITRIEEICNQQRWITEGTWSDYAERAFEKADLVVLIQLPIIVCDYNILKRHFSRREGERTTFLETIQLMKEARKYYKTSQPVSLKSHQYLIRKHNKNNIVIKKRKDINLLFFDLSIMKQISSR